MTAEHMTELAEIAEELKEARRYVRANVPYVQYEVDRIVRRMARWRGENYAYRDQDPLINRVDRIKENLSIGIEYIQVSPSVLEGYIDGAVFELRLKGE